MISALRGRCPGPLDECGAAVASGTGRTALPADRIAATVRCLNWSERHRDPAGRLRAGEPRRLRIPARCRSQQHSSAGPCQMPLHASKWRRIRGSRATPTHNEADGPPLRGDECSPQQHRTGSTGPRPQAPPPAPGAAPAPAAARARRRAPPTPPLPTVGASPGTPGSPRRPVGGCAHQRSARSASAPRTARTRRSANPPAVQNPPGSRSGPDRHR